VEAAVNVIRSHRGLETVPIVFAFENAPAGAAGHIFEQIKTMQPIIAMRESGSASRTAVGGKHVGCDKSENSTDLMHLDFVDQLLSNHLRFSRRFCSLPHNGSDGCAEVKDKLKRQMADYRPDIKKKNRTDNYNDDLLIAAEMLVYWGKIWYKTRYTNPEYVDFAQKFG